jgi:hypothetical protein
MHSCQALGLIFGDDLEASNYELLITKTKRQFELFQTLPNDELERRGAVVIASN